MGGDDNGGRRLCWEGLGPRRAAGAGLVPRRSGGLLGRSSGGRGGSGGRGRLALAAGPEGQTVFAGRASAAVRARFLVSAQHCRPRSPWKLADLR